MAQMLKMRFSGTDARIRCSSFFETVEKELGWEALRKPKFSFAEQYGRFIFSGSDGKKQYIPWVSDEKGSGISMTVEIKIFFSDKFAKEMFSFKNCANKQGLNPEEQPLSSSDLVQVNLTFQLKA